MERRQYGENTTLECRKDSYDRLNTEKRKRDILAVMRHNNKPMSANDIAHELYNDGILENTDRNNVSPRLTEMCKNGTIEPWGKDTCIYTGRTVTKFVIREA